MPTRMYFSSETAAPFPYTNIVDVEGDFFDTSGGQHEGGLLLEPNFDAHGFATVIGSGNVLSTFFVSPRLTTQVIDATCEIKGQAFFYNAFGSISDCDDHYYVIGVTNSTGTIYRGTLAEGFSGTSSGTPFPEFGNPTVGRNHQLVPNVLVQDAFPSGFQVFAGDRIVVMMGLTENSVEVNAGILYGIPKEFGDLDLDEDEIYSVEPSQDIRNSWIEFSADLEFVESTIDFGELTIPGSTSIVGALRDQPPVRYNVYKSINPFGPWELVNDTPMIDVIQGNEYTIPDLVNGQVYYIMVVGGRLDNETGEFLPVCGQPLRMLDDSGSKISNPNMISARPRRVSNVATASLNMQYNFLEGGSL